MARGQSGGERGRECGHCVNKVVATTSPPTLTIFSATLLILRRHLPSPVREAAPVWRREGGKVTLA